MQGESGDLAITIGQAERVERRHRHAGDGLPAGDAELRPRPGDRLRRAVLTVTARAERAPGAATVTVTGTPRSASAGPAPRSFTVDLTVQSACPLMNSLKA